MRYPEFIKNKLRNSLKRGLLGRLLREIQRDAPPKTVHIVGATRHDEKSFWRRSALGKSLKAWVAHPAISIEIHFENKRGLPLVYNESLVLPAKADVILFVHDDIWLDDPEWLPKLLLAASRYDVVGLAGNTRISRNQPAWVFKAIESGKFVIDSGHLSGRVAHGQLPKGVPDIFGPAPASCKLLDGVFLCIRTRYLTASKVLFDPRFDFHFYDLDFCRAARQVGLSLGTWPIDITHQSTGAFGTPAWQSAYAAYLNKWGS
jgi:glycosyltransferase involved in cell wall biosynthesis